MSGATVYLVSVSGSAVVSSVLGGGSNSDVPSPGDTSLAIWIDAVRTRVGLSVASVSSARCR